MDSLGVQLTTFPSNGLNESIQEKLVWQGLCQQEKEKPPPTQGCETLPWSRTKMIPSCLYTKDRLKEFFGDALAECSEDYDPQEVADAFVEELDSWITYHHNCANAYELIRESLRKRVCEA